MKKLTGNVLVVGGVADSADMRYASGYSSVDPAVFLRCGNAQFLVVPVLEKGRAIREAHPGVRVLTPYDLALTKIQRRRLSMWVLALLRRNRQRRVLVSAVCPAGIVQRLTRCDIRVEVAAAPLFPERAVKAPRELNAIRHAQRAAAFAMSSAMDFLRATRIGKNGFLTHNGRRVTSDDVRRVIDVALIQHDCIGTGTIAACGKQGADPHERGSGALRAHEAIVLDVFPQHRRSGYWGDLTRTVVRGEAPEPVRRMFAAVRDAHRAALKVVRAGAHVRKVHAAAAELLRARGFVTSVKGERPEGFVHSTGHGVGLDIHESPAVAALDGRLRAGHVITIEPGLYYPKIGGMRIEDTIVVTRNGWKSLARVPVFLEI